MFHQSYVNTPAIPPAPPPTQALPQLNLAHIPQQLRRAGVEYDSFLQQLTFNSKDVITGLTQIAGENLPYAEAIVTVVEQRAYHAPAQQKLPFLYLIDSIVKNIGAKYVTCFAANLYHTFINAYAPASVDTRMSMHRLLNTWPPIFGLDVVTAMRRSATDHDAQTATTQPQMPPQQQLSHGLRLPQSMQQPHAYNFPSNPRMPQPVIHPSNMQPTPPMQQPQTGMPPIPQRRISQTVPQSHIPQPPAGIPQHPSPQMTPGGPLIGPLPKPAMPPTQQRPVLQTQPGPPVQGMIPPPNAQAGVMSSAGVMPPPAGVMPPPAGVMPPPAGVLPPAPGQVALPRIVSKPVEHRTQAPLPPKFVEVQKTMQDISRKAAMGVHPSSHQVFTMNRLISQQLQSNPLPFQRDSLSQFQQQLRDICARQKQRNPSAARQETYPSSAIPPSVTSVPTHVPPIAVSAALTGLLRSMPPGLLSQTKPQPHLEHQQPTIVSGNNPIRPTSDIRSLPPMPRRRDMGTPVFQRPLPTALKFSDLKTMSHAGAVRALYTELPNLSKSDGMRFATKEELREHLDWLFHQNRRKRGKAPNVVVGGSSRGWYEHFEAFLGEQSGPGTDPSPLPVNTNSPDSKGLSNQASGSSGTKDRHSAVTEAKGENERCAACNESFESFWDDDRQSWMLRGAERTADGEVFHTKCIEMIEADEKLREAASADEANAEQPIEQYTNPETPAAKTEIVPTTNFEAKTEATPATDIGRKAEPVPILGKRTSLESDSSPSKKAKLESLPTGSEGLKLESPQVETPYVRTAPEIIPIPAYSGDSLVPQDELGSKVEVKKESENSTLHDQEVLDEGGPASGQKRKREEIEETTIDEGNVSGATEVNPSSETGVESQLTEADDGPKESQDTLIATFGERPGKKTRIEEEVLDGADGASVSPQ